MARPRRRLPLVAISMGDPHGIGPEVLALALAEPAVQAGIKPLVFGDRSILELAAALRQIKLPADLAIVELTRLATSRFRWGRPRRGAGRYPLAYLEAAVDELKAGRVAALCTGPIHKDSMARAGFAHAGHTDYLRDRFGLRQVVMMLVGPSLKVALATVHLPLSQVPAAISKVGLLESLGILDSALRRDFGMTRPRIAVAGLNPHAGENGLFGEEEARTIAPTVALARRRGLLVSGPFPADSLFARQLRTREFDAILAMYHDQGLGPLKAVDFERAVNVTLGLPRPRTSPDHGVAFDLAGQGRADPTSMIEALLLAGRLAA